MKRIGIYGGSFNPVHTGHVLAMERFIHDLSLDKLLAIPAGIPPHKVLADGSPDGFARAELLRLAVQHLDKVFVDEAELSRNGKCYTYDTICQLKEAYPDAELFLLMGTDMLLCFDKWYRYKDILSMVSLTVLNRYEKNHQNVSAMQLMKENLEQAGGSVQIIEDPCMEISSTTVRRMLAFDCAEAYIPASVYAEIREKKLYGVGRNMKKLPFEELKDIALSLHDAKRAPHAAGCSETAVRLAEHYGENTDDAARAGILHDITKALSPREQLRLCEKYAIMTDEYGGEQTKLLHGKTAAAIAKHIFDENDAVCSAVSWHTTGRADMSLLEKIIYIADYVEPNRDFPGVDKLRKLAFSDLDAAVLLGIEMTIQTLKEKHRPLNRHSVEAMEHLLKERKSG